MLRLKGAYCRQKRPCKENKIERNPKIYCFKSCPLHTNALLTPAHHHARHKTKTYWLPKLPQKIPYRRNFTLHILSATGGNIF